MKRLLRWGLVITLLALPGVLLGDGGAESGRAVRFTGKLSLDASRPEQCEFEILIERVSFLVNAVHDKYRMIRIRVDNRLATPLKLSPEDGIELEMKDGAVVRGTFVLQRHDPSLWDAMNDELRKALAYPQSVRAAKGEDNRPRQAETIYVFSFFPVDQVREVPVRFRYIMKETGQTVKIELPPPTKA